MLFLTLLRPQLAPFRFSPTQVARPVGAVSDYKQAEAIARAAKIKAAEAAAAAAAAGTQQQPSLQPQQSQEEEMMPRYQQELAVAQDPSRAGVGVQSANPVPLPRRRIGTRPSAAAMAPPAPQVLWQAPAGQQEAQGGWSLGECLRVPWTAGAQGFQPQVCAHARPLHART